MMYLTTVVHELQERLQPTDFLLSTSGFAKIRDHGHTGDQASRGSGFAAVGIRSRINEEFAAVVRRILNILWRQEVNSEDGVLEQHWLCFMVNCFVDAEEGSIGGALQWQPSLLAGVQTFVI